MRSLKTAGANTRALARDWLYALRYWLRGRNGVIALVVLAVVMASALNWSWLTAAGIAPLLITLLPCAAMCALGLCMSRIGGRSCSTETRSVETPKPDARMPAALEASKPGPFLTDSLTLSDQPNADPAIARPASPKC
jgi:hypothetical protein